MTLEEFRKKVPVDPQNLFWTHIELLRKCHIFGMDLCLKHGQLSIASVFKEK